MFLPGGIGPGLPCFRRSLLCCRSLNCNIRDRAVPDIGLLRPQPSAKIPIAGARRDLRTRRRLQFGVKPGVAAASARRETATGDCGRSGSGNPGHCMGD